MSLIDVNDENFESEVMKSNIPVLVDFWAPWCQPCKQLIPVMDELAEQYAGKAKIVKINTEESPAVARQFGIRGIPNVFLFNNGEKKLNMMGANPISAYINVLDKALEDGGEPEFSELLKDPIFTEGLIVTGEVDDLEKALKALPELANKPLSNGLSPMSMALRRTRGQRVEVLRNANPELSFIEHAALGDLDAVAAIIATNPEVINDEQHDGTTALWLATRHNEFDVCKYLLEKGADHSVLAGQPGITALAVAVMTDNVNLVALLLEHGADINTKGRSGESLLHSAVESSLVTGTIRLPLIQLLQEHGLDNSILNKEGKTPLESTSELLERYKARDDMDHKKLTKTYSELETLLTK